MMKKSLKYIFVMLIALSFLASPAAALKVTLIGEVNDNQQFVADNEIYEIDNNAVGDDLVFNHIAQRVKVTGQIKSVRESGGSDAYKVIKVESFEVVEE
ncbi:MAG: hypothetical protein PVI13_04215 [Desulfobacterales bacterium]|jgi:hypothetical protein